MSPRGDEVNKLMKGDTKRKTKLRVRIEERREHGTALPKKWKRFGG